MAKKKKEEKGKKAGKKAPGTNGAVAATTVVETADGRISERASGPTPKAAPASTLVPEERDRILDAWIGSGVRLRHPVNMNSAFAVGSTTGQLEATDDRGVLLRFRRDQLQFYPWNCVYAVMPDEKGKIDDE